MKTNMNGMTLIEILLVISILSLLATLSVPNLMRSQMTANEVSAIGGLKAIAVAETHYNASSEPHFYTDTLACLVSGHGAGDMRLLVPRLGLGVKAGYTYELAAGDNVSGSVWTWSATAWPIFYRTTGVRSFYIDDTGAIRAFDNNGRKLTVSFPPLD